MRTLRDFWNEFDGVVDLEERETSIGYWQIILNVE
jgi:hypothetical protein